MTEQHKNFVEAGSQKSWYKFFKNCENETIIEGAGPTAESDFRACHCMCQWDLANIS